MGECTNSCGTNGFEGVFAGIGRTLDKVTVKPVEECDDDNNKDGDGCSRTCELEDPTGTLDGRQWKCAHVFRDLTYEAPSFTTVCTRVTRRRLEADDQGEGEGA